jgi:hypothetical protein
MQFTSFTTPVKRVAGKGAYLEDAGESCAGSIRRSTMLR